MNDPQQKIELLDTIQPQYIILKPSLHGALTGAAEWMNLARERNIGYWVTSALESNVGLNAIAQWSAAIQSEATMPQGLGTGQLFVHNFESAPSKSAHAGQNDVRCVFNHGFVAGNLVFKPQMF